MKIYNVMTRKKEDFAPQEASTVKVYACGITVNGDAHLGHARQAITFNLMTEYLRLLGYNVVYVRNYTDIDDKIIAQAKNQGISPLELSSQRIAKTDLLMSKLLTRDADFKPRVSLFVSEIVSFISQLVKKGFAYESNGDVYFAVSKFDAYGKLSNRSTDDLLNNVRVEENQNKREPLDFALWKAVTKDEFGFSSPWGKGRPGWHIECSAMIKSILGDTIDIHGGGKDLIFPHHENEIAQSESLCGVPLAKFWIHNGLITVDGQKMSKSLNNFVTVEELLEQYDPEVLRFLMLQNHYASSLEVNKELLSTSERHMYNFYTMLDGFKKLVDEKAVDDFDLKSSEILKNFFAALNNDFNVSLFLADLFGIFSEIGKMKGEQKKQKILELLAVLKFVFPCVGLLQKPSGEFCRNFKQKYLSILNVNEAEIAAEIEKRKQAKAERNFAVADEIRAKLLCRGITLMDTAEGTEWGIA